MDIRENIYSRIRECEGIGYPENEKVAKELSHADTELLIQDMDQFYTNWFNIQKAQEESFDEETTKLEYIQETSFEIVCKALALQGDPAVIPYFFKYVPVDGPKHAHGQVVMEDYNSQDLEECITSVKYYGESYISVLLTHIHELIPDKMLEAAGFFYDMLYRDLKTFKDTHPLMSNLHLVKREPFLALMDYCLKQTLETFKEDNPDQVEDILRIIASPIDEISSETEGLIQIAYVQQQFLKLHAAD